MTMMIMMMMMMNELTLTWLIPLPLIVLRLRRHVTAIEKSYSSRCKTVFSLLRKTGSDGDARTDSDRLFQRHAVACNVLQQLFKSYRTCFKFYCIFYFTCDRSFKPFMSKCLQSWAYLSQNFPFQLKWWPCTLPVAVVPTRGDGQVELAWLASYISSH